MVAPLLSVWTTGTNVPDFAYAEVYVQSAALYQHSLWVGCSPDNVTPAFDSYAAHADGSLVPGGTGLVYGAAGDVVQLAIRQSQGQLWIGVNNVYIGGGDPAAGTSPTFTGLNGNGYYVALGLGGFSSAVLTGRFRVADFGLAMPSGAGSWSGV